MVKAVGYQASVQITDCLVKGSITDNSDESERAMAGFVSYNSGTYTLTRCLYVGKNNAPNDKYSYTFGTETGYGATFTDCYYLNTCGKAQGEQVTAERLKSGEMAKLLQGDRTENVWGQTLGTDNEPLPTTDATKRVYEVKFVYNGEVKATRYATNGQSIHGGMPTFTAKDLLGTGYNPHHYYAIALADNFNASTPVNADRKVDITLTEKDYYEIASKEDWKAFCALVVDGQNAVDAKMTKDVDLGTDIVMVGSYVHPYVGTFDGQNHVLTVNWDAGSANDVAPFRRVGGATIKNLRTEGSIRSNSFYLSGLIDEAIGENTVTGCVSNVNLTTSYANASCDAAGMICYIYSSGRVTISDCLVKGSINATTEKGQKGMGGFVFIQHGSCIMNNCLYAGTNNADNSNNNCYTFAPTNTSGATTTLNNCYYLNPCGEAQGTQVTAEQLKSGEVAKLLQGDRTDNVWGQTLGTDLEPLPTTDAKKRVYQVKFNYNGNEMASRYANNGQGIHGTLPTAEELLGAGYNPKLTYALNFGDFTATTPVTADKSVDVTVTVSGTFTIATAADWKAFCDLVNDGQTGINAKMTADIDLGEEIVMVGEEFKMYEGTFDGQNHTLTVNWDASFTNDVAPFAYVKDATIKNLRVKGHITGKRQLAGLICTVHGNTTLSNCVSEVDIKGESYLSGMIYRAENIAKVTFTDCVVKGALNSDETNNMAGFVYQMWGDCTFNNCLYLGTNNATEGCTFGWTHNITNCYYLNACGEAQGMQVTEEQLKNGAVAYKLQNGRSENVWGQKLGTDNEPMLTAEAERHVYMVGFAYNGEVKATRYANKGGHVSLPTLQEALGTDYNPHHYYTGFAFANGFNETTPVEGNMTVAVTVNEKDCYEIGSKEDWKTFCDLVNGGQNAIDAKMTADVDLGTDIAKVGTANKPYAGTFDGQNHVLTVNWDAGSANDVAPFRRVGGATIKNLRTEGSIRSNSFYLSGLIDEAIGENTVTGCVSNVNLTISYDKSSCGAAGLICCLFESARVTISDCLVKGSINATAEKGQKGMGGFVFIQHGSCIMNNCLYAGTNNASGGYTFASDSDPKATTTLNNCYYLNPCGKLQGEQATKAQLESGEVTKKLQGDRTDRCYWAQQLGKMPDFYNAADKSKANYVYYDAAKKGWACDDFRLTDEQPLPIGLDFTAATVTYERNFNGTQKATLCLPYDLSAQGFKAYTLSGGNKNEVHFKEVDDKLTAYTPYYITADGTPLLGGTNIEVKAYTGANLTTSANGYSIKGTVVSMDNATAAAANAYILQDDGMFHKVTTDNPGATVPAYHAYIICPPQASGAKQLSVVLDGETTGIGGVKDGTTGLNGPVYDLQGRRVADRLDDARHQLPAGVYIVGGRKVIVK